MSLSWIFIGLVAMYMLIELVAHAYHEWFDRSVPYWLARLLTFASRVWEQRRWGCECCGVSPRLVHAHDTHYKEYRPGIGDLSISILCERCWRRLTPRERWEKYQQFLARYPRGPKIELSIKQATLAGK